MEHVNIRYSLSAVVVLFLYSSLYSHAETNNWQYWNGPDRKGIAYESDWDPAFLKKPLRINWKTNVGMGYSNVSIMGNRLYTAGYDDSAKKNTIYCLDAATGKEIWKYSYGASVRSYPGTRSTPVIEDGKVYTLGQDGDFICNDAITGKLLWKRQVADEFGAELPKWMLASSAFIDGRQVIVNACRYGVSLDKETGEVIWKSPPGTANYSTPVKYVQNGREYLAIFGNDHLYGVDALTGRSVWSYPWTNKCEVNAADPLYFDGKIFISSAYGAGCVLLDVTGKTPVEVWRNDNMNTHFSTVIKKDGYVYAMDGNVGADNKLKCINLADGSVKWEQALGFGNILAANGYLLLLNEKGKLHVIKMESERYNEVSSKEGLLEKTCWTAPVICRSVVYLRNNKGDLISIDASGAR